jgi:hypothetical protein
MPVMRWTLSRMVFRIWFASIMDAPGYEARPRNLGFSHK